MKQLINTFATAVAISSGLSAFATDSLMAKNTERYFYVSGSFSGAILSTAAVSGTASTSNSRLSTPRFSYLLNTGANLNYNFNERIGAFAGLELQNIGFIQKIGDLTIKRRTYTLGVPVGIKIGSMSNRGAYLFSGLGADLPVNYREKRYIKRGNKEKFNEWFSERTPIIMPYMFVGYKFRKNTFLRAQYYLTNFMDQDYTDQNGVKPYKDFGVNVMHLSFGYTLPYKKGRAFRESVFKLNVKKGQ
jgi:hypothetical protein